jgi:hypothetical protein
MFTAAQRCFVEIELRKWVYIVEKIIQSLAEPKNYYFVRLSSDQIQNQPNSCGYFWCDSLPQLKEEVSVYSETKN